LALFHVSDINAIAMPKHSHLQPFNQIEVQLLKWVNSLYMYIKQ